MISSIEVAITSVCCRDHSGTARLATALLVLGLASSLLARTAAGSCLSYGHSCWGAHGKRSELAPRVPPGGIVPNSLSGTTPDDVTGWSGDETEEWPQQRDVTWHKLTHAATPHHSTRRSQPVVTSVELEDEEAPPPPRWLYQLMRQAAAANKLD